MRRARQQLVTGLLVTAAVSTPAPAIGYHAGNLFDRPPGAGGAGGIFYSGTARERGWDCTACHIEPEGRITFAVAVTPSAAWDRGQYEPDQTYAFTITLQGEHRGLSSPRSNFNGIVVTVVDETSAAAGSLFGFAAEDFYASGSATIATAGGDPGVTEWTFQWLAPGAGAGPVTVHLAGVDGNGADSGPNETLSDPFDDDVFVIATALVEAGSARFQPESSRARGDDGLAVALLVFGLLVLGSIARSSPAESS